MQSLFLLCVFAALLCHTGLSEVHPDNVARKRQAAPAASPLVNFQVSEPVLTPSGTSNQNGCIYEQLLMDHVFAFSYGKPFVGGCSQALLRRTQTLTVDRVLCTASLQLQPRYHELHSHLERTAIRSPGSDVSRRYRGLPHLDCRTHREWHCVDLLQRDGSL